MFIVMRMLWFQFIGCEVLGVCARVFCDFGDEFEVSDATGEEPKELFIQNITQVAKANPHTHTHKLFPQYSVYVCDGSWIKAF